MLLAVYDMQANRRSGTGYTVHYAQAQREPVVAIDPDNFSVSFSDTENNLFFFNNLATNGDKTVLINGVNGLGDTKKEVDR